MTTGNFISGFIKKEQFKQSSMAGNIPRELLLLKIKRCVVRRGGKAVDTLRVEFWRIISDVTASHVS